MSTSAGDDRMVGALKRDEDAYEASLRPSRFAEFIGQRQAIDNLTVFIQAARSRGEALDHVLLAGPPGLGKTTLAQIVAREMGVNFRATSGPVIARAGELAALLTNLQENDLLFIDEIHRLAPAVEEILYPAMEDFQLDLIIGEGPAARSVRIDLPRFTLVGATTRSGLLTTPLRDRFGIPVRLEFYGVDDLCSIVERGARVMDFGLSRDGAIEIARRSRGTPRVAGRLLRRVRDFSEVAGHGMVDADMADMALTRLEVDGRGLDAMDRRYLRCIGVDFGGGPVGIETIAASLSEPRDAIEDIIEPYLLQQAFIQRTPRGRILTPAAYKHLGLAAPAAVPAAQMSLPTGKTMSDWMSGTVSQGVHTFPVRVYFEDTDTAQMVYHANYLRYMERARTELLRLVGVSQYDAMRGGVGDVMGFAVKSCQVEFRAPARLDDLLQVRTVNNGVGAAYIDFGQDIWRNDTPIAEARIRVVCLDGQGKPRRQPTDLIARLKTMLPPRDTAKA